MKKNLSKSSQPFVSELCKVLKYGKESIAGDPEVHNQRSMAVGENSEGNTSRRSQSRDERRANPTPVSLSSLSFDL